MSDYWGARPDAGAVLVWIAGEGLRRQIVEFLKRYGLRVLVADAESEVLGLAATSGTVNLLLADTRVSDAPRLVREAALRSPEIRLLVISGDPESINRELVPDPWVHFIEKPFSWCEFGERIARLLRPAMAPEPARATANRAAAAA